MQDIQCIFCNRSSDEVAMEENGYVGRRCPDCGLIYVSPRPDPDEIVDLYGHDNAHVSAEALLAGGQLKRLNAKRTIKLLTRHIRSGDLLEIGPGGGQFLTEAKEAGFNPYAIELNPVQANYIRDSLKIPCESTGLATSSFDGKTFDVIYHCDVLSHFYDPIEEFRKIHTKLSDAGVVLFETGNLADVDAKHYRQINSFQFPDHLFFFGEQSILELLKRTGFEPLEICRHSIVPQQLFLRLQNYIDEKRFLWRLNRLTTAQWKHFVRYGLGRFAFKKSRPQTVTIVARKT